MEIATVGLVLMLGIAFCGSLFHFVPILSKSHYNHKSSQDSLSQDLMNISHQLFEEDRNNFLSLVDVNFQGFLNSTNTTNKDSAPEALLKLDAAIVRNEIIKRMKVLYDNFELNSSIEEKVTDEELTEENEFILSLLDTSVMKLTMEFLEQKKIVTKDPKDHFKLIKELWFDFYPRNKNTTKTSSGFEHIFLAEVKKGKVIGLHNWIYFAEAEKLGALDYKGWIKQVDLGQKAKIAKIRFSLKGLTKPVSSFFIGTSPELEIAIYTICFLLRPDKYCRMSYDNVKFSVTSHSLLYEGRKYIGSAYVVI